MTATVQVELRGFVVRVDFLDGVENLGRLVPLSIVPAAVPVDEETQSLDKVRVGFVVVKIENLVPPDWLSLPFDDLVIDLSRPVGCLYRLGGELADENMSAVLLAGALDAGGQVYTVANNGIVNSLG